MSRPLPALLLCIALLPSCAGSIGGGATFTPVERQAYTIFVNNGSTPMDSGDLTIFRREGEQIVPGEEIHVMLFLMNVPPGTYDLHFCPFGQARSACFRLRGIATTPVQPSGVALNDDFKFDADGTFAGVFEISNGSGALYVSGFHPGVDHDQEFRLIPARSVGGGVGIATGSDPLRTGRVIIEGANIRVRLEGAAVTTAYTVRFCAYDAGPAGCLDAGLLTTDASGNANATVPFASSGDYGGVVLLMRDVSGAPRAQFITGFEID